MYISIDSTYNIIHKLKKQVRDREITEYELIKKVLYIDDNSNKKNRTNLDNKIYDRTYRYFLYNSSIDDEPDYIEDTEYIEIYSN